MVVIRATRLLGAVLALYAEYLRLVEGIARAEPFLRLGVFLGVGDELRLEFSLVDVCASTDGAAVLGADTDSCHVGPFHEHGNLVGGGEVGGRIDAVFARKPVDERA